MHYLQNYTDDFEIFMMMMIEGCSSHTRLKLEVIHSILPTYYVKLMLKLLLVS